MSINRNNGLDGYYVGIDAGSTSLNSIVISRNKEIVYEVPYRRHFGKVEEETYAILQMLHERFEEDKLLSVSFTGSHGKKLGERLGAFYEFETISQVLGVLFLIPDAKTIVSMGGQDTALFQIKHCDLGWELEYFNMNGLCASGTGSFIDQQAERLATSMYGSQKRISQNQIDNVLNDFVKLGLKGQKPANVACRCTVFTKSDMIHLQNKGERLEEIIYGLHAGNARNYMSAIVSKRVLEEPIVFIGGLSLNALQVRAFKQYFPNLIVPPYSTSVGALGVALKAHESEKHNYVHLNGCESPALESELSVPTAPKLVLKKTVFTNATELHRRRLPTTTRAYLGIDIGSTTTKYALINECREILHKCYVPTQGKPIAVTQKLLEVIWNDVGDKIEIMGTATTGSGRQVVGDFLGADLIIDEITAHARGAVEINTEVDTIFEIGGQDSKYIHISNTHPLDFDMNKVCAAGTGSFLHELANKYGINIVKEFQEIALSSERPVKLAERCTVFMESDLMSYYQKGVAKKDLIAGLCYAIVHNYLNRVVGKRKIGLTVMFLGGPSLNKGVVAAFENVLGRGLIVPRHREVLGAYGAAICVQEKMLLEGRDTSRFRGFQSAINDRMIYTERICRADPYCHNRCKLKIYEFSGRRSIWGGECGRHELSRTKGHKQENIFELRRRLWETQMAGVYKELREEPLMEVKGRPTVGMQRALYWHQTGILWAHFFDRLGFRLVLTPPTDTSTSKCGIESSVDGACYPVKISHGHIKKLVDNTRYLFIPSMVNMPTPKPSEKGFYCPLVQSNSYMVRAGLGIDRASILNPVVHLKYDPEELALEISDQIGSKLGVTRALVEAALYHALERQRKFVKDVYQKGTQLLEKQQPNEPIIVVTGRPYNLYDEKLNLRLGQNLAKIGVKALPMDFVDVSLVDLSDFSSMYWGLGAQILRTARYVKEHKNFFGLHLTNFGCGADSFIEHFYKHIMGDKPYLILELDEHSAMAGVMTRIEAYKNVIENVMEKLQETRGFNLKVAC